MSVDISPKRPPISSCTAAAPAGSGSDGGGSSVCQRSMRRIMSLSSCLERVQTRMSGPGPCKPPVRGAAVAITVRVPLDAKYTPIYLNDHLAGSTAGASLAKRTLGSNRGTQFEPALERLAREIQEDRETLREIMGALDVGEDTVKKLVPLVAERAGRLKLNGSFFSYSPLSRLVEFEGLALGITGKLALWISLREAADDRLAGFDLAALEARGREQQGLIEEQRAEAARIALVG